MITLFKNIKHRAKTIAREEFEPLISFQDGPEVTGRGLFAKEKKGEVLQLSEDGPSSNAAANYQTALKNLWDGLTDEKKAEWEQKALDLKEQVDECANDSEHISRCVYGLCSGHLYTDSTLTGIKNF
jgi:hypothetical protein